MTDYPKVNRAFIYVEKPFIMTYLISNAEEISKELNNIGIRDIISIKGIGMLGIRSIRIFPTGELMNKQNMQLFCYPVDSTIPFDL